MWWKTCCNTILKMQNIKFEHIVCLITAKECILWRNSFCKWSTQSTTAKSCTANLNIICHNFAYLWSFKMIVTKDIKCLLKVTFQLTGFSNGFMRNIMTLFCLWVLLCSSPYFLLSLYNHFMLMWALKFRLRYIPEYWIKFALKSQFSQIKINVQICYNNFWTLYHYFWMQFTWVGGLIDTITCTTLNLFVVIKFCCLDMWNLELKSRKQKDFYYINFFDLALLSSLICTFLFQTF